MSYRYHSLVLFGQLINFSISDLNGQVDILGQRPATEAEKQTIDFDPATVSQRDRGVGLDEQIKSAAIRHGGVTYIGKNHAAIIGEIARLTQSRVGSGGQGFVTTTGRFVDRKEAARIALSSGQITKLKYFADELDSGDLNDSPES